MAAKNLRVVLAARRRRRQASAWFVRRMEPELTPQLLRRWEQWHSVAENRRAYEQVVLVWADLGQMRTGLAVSTQSRLQPLHRVRAVPFAGAIVACLTAAALAVWMLLPTGESIETNSGQWKLQRLADGTQLHVGPNSQLRVALGDTERNVHVTRGEMVFAVPHESARPFIVRTQWGNVQAIGSKFGVASLGGPLVVTVAEGEVAVSPRSRAPGLTGQGVAPIPITAGEQISVGDGAAVRRRVDARRELAWAQGPLVDMSGATIGDVVGEFNRRNRLQIVLDDPAIAAMRMPARVIRADDPELFVEYLKSISSIVASREAPNLVLVKLMPGADSQSSHSR